MIFFDIDGTLIDHLSASAAASLSFYDHFSGRIPFAREGFAEIWEAIVDKHFNRYCRAEISMWEQRRARMREVFGGERLSDAECDSRYSFYIREYESMTSAYDDAADCLRDLNGMPLGIISNGAPDQQTGKLERAGLLQHFSVLVFSEDVAIGKPAALIFEEACRLAGENPSQCVHVGDDLTADIAGGLNAGLRVVWLDRMRKFTHVEAAARIEHLAELASALNPELAHVQKR